MSRSRKKCIGDTRLVRTPVCCVGDHGMKLWRRRYNRSMRRRIRHQINCLDLLNIEDDETFFIDDPEFTSDGNSWSGPGDGWMKWDIDRDDFWPEYKYLMK